MRSLVLATSLLLVAGSTQFASAQTVAPVSPPVVAVAPASNIRFIKLGEDAKLNSNVVGLNVFNSEKVEVGEIKDVAVDATGVRAYILSVGGFLGMGTHYVAVVPSQVNVAYMASDKKWHATMNITKEELKAAPEFKYEGMWNAPKS